MAGGGFPNKNRAINAYDAYGDAMRPYIEQVLERTHGPGWVRSRLLTDDLRKSNDRRYDEVERALRSKKPPLEILDRADIPNLVNGDLANFPDLSRDDARRLFAVRDLRNDIVHSARSGDCTVEEANAIASLCTLALERCGLSEAAENIRRISSAAMPAAQETSEADRRKERERREWDKARLAEKSPGELTPWEQQRLDEIEWEEEWERRELVRSEREAIAALGDDIDELRGWFDADEARRDRHPPKHAALLQREQGRREQREREQRKREQEERERRERELWKSERAKIAAFGDDIDGLGRWFDTDKSRRGRHPSEYATVHRREQERRKRREREQRKERERRERERKQARQERVEREQAEIAAFGDDLDGLRRWFDKYGDRRKLHPSEYSALLRWERERHQREQKEREREQKEREWNEWARRERERREQGQLERELRERERAEIAAFGDDLDGLRRWFNADTNRRQRYPSEYAALGQRGRVEIAAFGDDIDGRRRWFDADKTRPKHHPGEYNALLRRERLERERAVIAAFGDDIDGLRRWFNADMNRWQRHSSAHMTLVQREQQQTGSTAARTSAAREQKQHRWPPGPVDSKSRTGGASSKRPFFSRIFRR